MCTCMQANVEIYSYKCEQTCNKQILQSMVAKHNIYNYTNNYNR